MSDQMAPLAVPVEEAGRATPLLVQGQPVAHFKVVDERVQLAIMQTVPVEKALVSVDHVELGVFLVPVGDE